MLRNKFFYIWLMLCVQLAHSEDIIHKYSISISKDLSTLFINAQFAETDFYYLYAGSESAARHTKNMHFLSQKSHIYTLHNEELKLHRNASGQTLSYEFDLKSALGTRRWSSARQVGDDISAPPDLWLWRPYSMQENEHIEVTFNFPADIQYSVPWTPVAKDLYRIPPTPVDWPSAAVFGTFNKDTIIVRNSVFSIAFMDGSYKTTRSEIKQWLKGAAQAVCSVYDTFPVDNVQVIIYPGGPGHEPVPFGMVVRGGGITINFYIDPSRPLNEFIADWTATHEMSHCLLPLISGGNAWLSEGLATYYQYVLMGRDGRLTEQQTWQRIYNGFQKGIRGNKGKSLKSTAAQMRKLRAFRYVYWSGAAMFLKVDMALRQQSNGTKTLNNVLKLLQREILPQNRSWGGREMMETMDRLSSSTVFTEIYDQHIYNKDFPVDDDFWALLGVLVDDGQIRIDNNAPLANIRKNILN